MTTLSKTAQLMDALASLLNYPDKGYPKKLQLCDELLQGAPEFGEKALTLLKPFQDFVSENSLSTLEEAFTQVFDFNKESALEVGWHLYGEDYARGDFLVKMRDLLRQGGVKETSELPDHLTHLLPIVGRMDEKSGISFSTQYLIPSLSKMLDGIKKKESPYEHVLKAIYFIVLENYADPLQIPGDKRHEF